MKKYLLLFYSLFFTLGSLVAQKGLVATATDFIVREDYLAANLYLDSLLRADSTNVDALMMKGNVCLNQALGKLPNIKTIAKPDESIFTSGIGTIAEEVKIIPTKSVIEIERWWKKCLQLDKQRVDIHQGLCTVYAMALMKVELENQIAELLKIKKDETGEQAYQLAEYARKFKERGRFDEAIEIYEFIARQFPDLAGIRCDIGSEFFYDGRMNDALRYLDSAMSKKSVDESSYLNAAFIYSELGYFDQALKCFSDYSKYYNAQMDLFYKGLMMFSNQNIKYSDTLNRFISSIDSNAYYPEYLLATRLLSYKEFTMANYQQIIKAETPEWYLPLIYQRTMRQYPDSCQPFIDYGIFQSRIKNYQAAVQFLEEGENCNIEAAEKEYWMICYAYTLYQIEANEKSLLYFKQLTLSKNDFYQQASKYFMARLLIKQGQVKSAKSLLEEIVSAAQKTKYQALAERLLAGL
ncbi:MAG: hypothetical protein IPP77_08130 [Bacteroidetes bacterium]|nr:hypothetical protein [Bacteroidota bacterium]